jgi:hypothetical protein
VTAPALRLEGTELTERGLRTTVAYVPAGVDQARAEQLRPVADEAVAQVVALGLTAGDARLLLALEVAKAAADAEAYEREAARRGVLAL